MGYTCVSFVCAVECCLKKPEGLKEVKFVSIVLSLRTFIRLLENKAQRKHLGVMSFGY